MSVALSAVSAEYVLDLRRDIAGLRGQLRTVSEENDRLTRRCERLEKALRAIAAAGVAHRLNVENMIREVI